MVRLLIYSDTWSLFRMILSTSPRIPRHSMHSQLKLIRILLFTIWDCWLQERKRWKLGMSCNLFAGNICSPGQSFVLHGVKVDEFPGQSLPPWYGPSFDLDRYLVPEPHDFEHELQYPQALHAQSTKINRNTIIYHLGLLASAKKMQETRNALQSFCWQQLPTWTTVCIACSRGGRYSWAITSTMVWSVF